MAKRTDPFIEREAIELYNSGLSMAKVGKKLNINAVTVMTILDRYNIPKRTKGGIYKLLDEEIIEKYKSGQSCQTIANQYDVDLNTIINILKAHNIDRDNRYHNLDFNHDYFETIDSYDKAYFLGFMITDGGIGYNTNDINLGLKPEDEYILELFAEKTHNSNKIYHRKDKPESVFKVKSKKMKNDLAQYGVTPRKGQTVYLPKLDEVFMPHLIRGLLDGNGSISYKSHYVYFCGNKIIVTQLKNYLVNRLGVYNVKIMQPEWNLCACQWGSQKDIIKIGNFIYKDKQDCYLKRKFKNFQIIQGNTEVTN